MLLFWTEVLNKAFVNLRGEVVPVMDLRIIFDPNYQRDTKRYVGILLVGKARGRRASFSLS